MDAAIDDCRAVSIRPHETGFTDKMGGPYFALFIHGAKYDERKLL